MKLIRQTMPIVNIYVKIAVVFVKMMWMVQLYVTITVVFVKMMLTVKLCIFIIHYYIFIGSYEDEYLDN